MRLRPSLPARVWLTAVGIPSVLGAVVLGIHASSMRSEAMDHARDTLSAIGSVRAAAVAGTVDALEATTRMLAASAETRSLLEGEVGDSSLALSLSRLEGELGVARTLTVTVLDASLEPVASAGTLPAAPELLSLASEAAEASRSGLLGVIHGESSSETAVFLEPVPGDAGPAGWVVLNAAPEAFAVVPRDAPAAMSVCTWMLVDQSSGRVIAGSRPTDGYDGALRSDGVLAAVASADPVGNYQGLQLREVIGQVQELPEQGWAILTEVPREAVEAGADVRLGWGLGVLLFIAVASVLVGRWLSYGVLRWVSGLTEVTRRVGAGDYTARVPVEGDDEFARAARGFNLMAESFSHCQKRAEEACADAKRQSKAKGDFLANMTHEIRTPLTAILGNAQVARSDETLTPEQAERVDSIIRSSRHLADLVNDVLEMSKVESGATEVHRRSVELEPLFKEIHEMFALTASRKSLELRVDLQSGLPESVITDRRKVRQVVINLVGNALRYTEKGSVHVVAAPDESGRGLVVEVRDTGRGIEPEDLPRIFEAFDQGEQMPALSGGTGLGLSISRTYAKLLGGTLDATSEVGKGSVFRFCLPDLARPGGGMECGGRKRSGAVSAPVAGLHVLLVDDDAEVRTAISRGISSAGGRVTCVGSGAEALKIIQDRDVDLALVDLRMRGMDGVETVRHIREAESGEHVAIVAMSGTAVQGDVDAVLQAGADDFVSKPFDFDDLWERVEYAVAKHRQRSKGSTMVTRNSMEAVATAIRDVPTEALTALAGLALEGDISSLRAAVEELSEEHPEAAAALEPIVRAFRYEELVELCGGEGSA